uniref:Sodium channel epithelial 1 subunit delta n=1 Tax=Crocodylus porosus TaxID=8502 RepID=A0A7M4FRN0_CROPO
MCLVGWGSELNGQAKEPERGPRGQHFVPSIKEEGLIEFYDSYRDMFEFFCKNTTIHGTIRLVCSDSNKMKTAFWTLLFLASFGMLYWQFALLFSQYWTYPVVTTMSMHSEPKMFPAITLCNLNPYRVSENLAELDFLAMETIASLYGSSAGSSLDRTDVVPHSYNSPRILTLHTWSLISSLLLFPLQCNATGENCFDKTYSSGVDAILEWYKFHYMNIMSQLPWFISVFSLCSDYDHFHHPVYGSCYTFNKDGTNPFWKATKPGVAYGMLSGLSLILKAEQKDHIALLSTVAGVKVMIHNYNQTPFLEHEGFDIRPGIATTIGIQQDEVHRLGGNYGKCTVNGDDVNVKLLYKSSYTLQACVHSCFQNIMIQHCGCGYYYYPLPPDAEYCNYNKHPAWGHCFYQLYNRLADHHLSCFNKCPKPCRSVTSAEDTYSPEAPAMGRLLCRDRTLLIASTLLRRKDIAKVTIFYHQLNYQSVNESPLLTLNLLLSSMGSQWSLWFGSSVLSVVEMLEFLLDTIVFSLIFGYKWSRSKKTLKMAQSPVISSVSLTLENYRTVPEGPGTESSSDTHPPVAVIAGTFCRSRWLGWDLAAAQ